MNRELKTREELKAGTLQSNSGLSASVKHKILLCKPPLDHNRAVDAQNKAEQAVRLHDNSTLLGFKHMVAPISKIARQGDPSVHNPPIPGDVQKLLGRIHASSKMAPDLHMVIR